jgi:cytochrome b561/polyisoprenoid-binding protein YceI
MQLRSTPNDWGSIAKIFHWGTAIFIITMLVIGITMTRFLEGDLLLKFSVYQLHKSFGFVILVFSVMRLLWRVFAQETPRAPSGLPQYQRWLGQAAHLLLYSLLFAMPITGLIAASASPLNVPTVIFGLFALPRIVGPSVEISAIFQAAHAFAFRRRRLAPLCALRRHASPHAAAPRMIAKAQARRGSPMSIRAFIVSVITGVYAIGGTPTVHAAEWQILSADSSIQIQATQFGQPFKGSFERFGGHMDFEPGALPTGNVRIEVDVASLKTGSPDRDAQAQNKDWFDFDRFPNAIFAVQRFRRLGGEHYEADGTLSIKGVTMPVVLPFVLTMRDNDAEMRGTLVLKRLTFGLGTG